MYECMNLHETVRLCTRLDSESDRVSQSRSVSDTPSYGTFMSESGGITPATFRLPYVPHYVQEAVSPMLNGGKACNCEPTVTLCEGEA